MPGVNDETGCVRVELGGVSDEYVRAALERAEHARHGCFGHKPPPGTPSIPSVFDGYSTPSKYCVGGSGEEPAQTPEEPDDVVGAPV